jgi:diguanylate cyclase (GGDEF)-like protein
VLRNSAHFSTRFLLPVAAAAGITILALTGFLAWSANRIDADALQRETRLMQRAIEEEKARMRSTIEEMAVWDDAILAYEEGDIDWLIDSIGVGAYELFTHNRIMLVEHTLEPILAILDGGEVAPETAAQFLPELQPLFDELGNVASRAAISAFNRGVSDTAPAAMRFMMYEARPALVSAMPLLSYSGDNALPAGTEPYYISAVFLDDFLAQYLGDQYLVAEPGFSVEPSRDKASLPILDIDGKNIAWLTWQADRPGARLLLETIPALLGGLIMAAVIIGLLLRSLRATLAQLQVEREEAHHRALHDPLTGLGNRSLFHTKLGESMRAMPRGAPSLALLALDLDRFKQVNDTMGHAAGDELLRQVGARITALLRPQDTLVRLGGDEFAVIQPDISSNAEPEALAKAIIDALAQPVYLSTGAANIGTSIGIATAPDIALNQDELARFADDALYRAKNGGRNRYCLYTPDEPNSVVQLDGRLRDNFTAQTG